LAFAETERKKGKIIDNETGEGIGFAAIKFYPNQKTILSDDLGYFPIEKDYSEQKFVIVSFTGYWVDTFQIAKHKDFQFRLRPKRKDLEQVVISGTMNEVQRKESVLPIEVYTPTLFKKTWAPSLLESVNMINGVQPQLNCNVCSAGDIHINGLEGAYTMILIDGMPIVSSLSTVYGLSGIPQSLIKRIEVVKGPASTLYGSEAVAGLINVITKSAGFAPLVKVELSGTSIGEVNLEAATKWRVGNQNALLGINAFYYGLPKDINNDHFTDIALQKRISVFNKWDFKTNSLGKSSLAIRLFAEDRWGGQTNWSPQWKGSDSIYGENIDTRRLEVLSSQALSKDGKLRLDFSYNYHFQNSYYGVNHFKADQHTAFSQLVWSGSTSKLNWVTGLPFRFVYYDDNTPATESIEIQKIKNQGSRTFLPGIFAQADYMLSNKWTGLAGIRFDVHNIHGGIWTPRLGFKYKINQDQSIRLSGGSGFRVVNLFTEDHAALTGARQVIIKNNLLPERSWNANAGYQLYINHSKGFSNIEINLFYTRFSNQIVGDFETDADKIIYDNLNGFGISHGLSINYERQLDNGFKAMAGLTWMDVYRMKSQIGDELKRETQLFAPPLSGTFSISYSKKDWNFDFTGRVNGPMKLPVFPNDFRPAWSPIYPLLNIQASKRLKHGFEMFAGIRNLLNFIPKDPILRPFDPFDKRIQIDNPNGFNFDPTYNYAPVQGLTVYSGIRWALD
jgi:outer membrane receptor for ferrienterochelin and colicins